MKYIGLFKVKCAIRPALAFFAVYVLVLAGCTRELPPVEVDVNAKSAMITGARTGEMLYEKDPDKRYPPASTVKVMTAVVAVENMPLESEIVPTKKALRVEPTVAGLKTGVGYKLRDLLAAILIKSANDAAVAIAESVSGSETRFVELMNAKAVEIGMNDTRFANASGLPTGKKDRQYSTARDLAKMMRYALRYRVILDEMSKKEAYISGTDGREIYLKTHNKALLRYNDAPWGKTGYTIEARRTFVGVDPSLNPMVVFSLLKSNDLWDDIMTLKRKGLEIYEEKRKNFFTDLIDWIRSQRRRGKVGTPH
ncbi:MAG: serine hydrolase [Candidatus Omnitrophota bacterium]|nr:serine hydrolase [Candidatus Omnitrophota bacterium]